MLKTIATTLIPVAFVILLGFLAGWRKFFGPEDRATITRLVMIWLLPALLLGGILQTSRAELLNYRIPVIFLLGLLAPFFLVLFIYRNVFHSDRRTAALKANLMTFPDMVFMGIPILHQLFGPASLFPILIANLIPSLIITPLTTLLLELGPGKAKHERAGGRVFLATLVKAVRDPKVWVPITGAVLVVLNVRTPQFVISSLDLIGKATTGLSLFVVGLIVAEGRVELSWAAIADIFFKSLVAPALMFCVVLALHVTSVLAREAIILAAIPSAVIASMFAEQYHVMQGESATAVLGTRIASFATIPLVIALTQNL